MLFNLPRLAVDEITVEAEMNDVRQPITEYRARRG